MTWNEVDRSFGAETTSKNGYKVVLEDVCFRPSRDPNRYVLKHVTLALDPGEFVAIVGSNGAGKSTILKAITGELKITSGRVTVGGQRVTEPINRIIDGVGIVHQREAADLVGHLSIARNIAVRQLLGGGHPGKLLASSSAWRREVASILGSEVPAEDFDLNKTVSALSGGGKQMLSVAIAVHLEHRQNPCRLLILDEHTSRLDHVNAKKVMKYTADQIEKTGATALMVTHRYDDALRYGQKLIVIRDGIIVDVRTRGKIDSVDELSRLIEGGGS